MTTRTIQLTTFGAALFWLQACGDSGENSNGDISPLAGAGGAAAHGASGAGGVSGNTNTVGTGAGAGGNGVTGGPAGGGNGGASGDTGIAGGGAGAAGGSGDAAFDACMAKVKPLCVASEHDTPELMETPCASMQMIPIPLTDGSTYGPITLPSGPYAGALQWNEGAGTEFVNPVNLSESVCLPIGIDSFREPKSVNDEIKNLRDVDYSLYTIFHPACFKEGETYPVITWANGTCGQIAGYAPLLGSIAAHGFVIIASNSTWTNTVPTNSVQARALDYAEALNANPDSIFYKRLDLEHVGAMGHSQGAAATGVADGDPRVDAVIFWNAGNSNEKPFLNVSGDRDVPANTPANMATGANGATQPGAWLYYHKVLETGGTSTGHLVLMEQPERVIEAAVAWWKWQLKADEEAETMFLGDDCGLCNQDADFEYGHNTKLQ